MFYVAARNPRLSIDGVFVTQPDLLSLDMVVLWHMPLIVLAHALMLLRLAREMIGVGHAGACRAGDSRVCASPCRVNMSRWRTQVHESWVSTWSDSLARD